MIHTRTVSTDKFAAFIEKQADEAENANYHDLCAAFHEWARALEVGEVERPPPGRYGFIGGTPREDMAFFVVEVTPA